jgi:hypothetical protein
VSAAGSELDEVNPVSLMNQLKFAQAFKVVAEENIIIEKLDILKNKWNYKQLSNNKKIIFKYVIDNPELRWDYNILSSNPNITLPAAKYFRFSKITLEL